MAIPSTMTTTPAAAQEATEAPAGRAATAGTACLPPTPPMAGLEALHFRHPPAPSSWAVAEAPGQPTTALITFPARTTVPTAAQVALAFSAAEAQVAALPLSTREA